MATFGKTTIGANWRGIDNTRIKSWLKQMNPEDGTLDSLSIYLGSLGGGQINLAIYSSDGRNRLAQGSPITPSPNAWNTISMSCSLIASVYYWFAFKNQSGTTYTKYDVGTGNICSEERGITWGDGSFPATLTQANYSTDDGSIYGTYTPGAPPVAAKMVLGDGLVWITQLAALERRRTTTKGLLGPIKKL